MRSITFNATKHFSLPTFCQNNQINKQKKKYENWLILDNFALETIFLIQAKVIVNIWYVFEFVHLICYDR